MRTNFTLILLGVVTSLALAQAPPKDVSQPYLSAGLRNADGSDRPTPAPNKTTGRTLDVTRFGADIADSEKDDQPAIEAALEEAKSGDEVYFPNGTYNLNAYASRHPGAHIFLKSGVNLRGESEGGVFIKSSYDGGVSMKNFATVRGVDVHDVVVSHLTLTSTWNRTLPTNPRTMNPDRGGPLYGIAIDSDVATNERLRFEHITVERFARMGIRLGKGTFDSAIGHCTARNATDIGGGGSGYGFSLQGSTHHDADVNPFLGTNGDNAYNVVEHSHVIGPYMRHGILIQFWAHNNVVRFNRLENTVYDAIDLHGEDEYLNEVHHNVIEDVSAGAGIGIGNSGATHDKTGPWNWVHHNTVKHSKVGLSAEFGTLANVIEDNLFDTMERLDGSVGLHIGYVQDFIIRRNRIIDHNSARFTGIRLSRNLAMGTQPSGVATSSLFEDNTVSGTTGMGARAVRIGQEGPGNQWRGNQFPTDPPFAN